MTRSARLKAYAKLNLGLRVLYKRPDSYHELRTVFQTISLADSFEFEGTPEIPDNLVERAARLVLDAAKVHARVRFVIGKKIPLGAGLGGGSTDAAAVLLALPVLAGKNLPADRLFDIAGQLGSDVPFFLHGGTALGLGRGEELYPLPDRKAVDRKAVHGILIAPNVHSSTAEAYRDLSAQLTSIRLQNKLSTFQQEVWQESGAALVNDFEEPVFGRHPALRQIKDRLRRLGANPAAMTGSGSAIFGIFAEPDEVIRARQSFPGEKVFPITFVTRAQYRSQWNRMLQPHTKGAQWPPRSLYAR
jgi:4-diphosphocytidyl-2-C-methyl-D-erythritol kinase